MMINIRDGAEHEFSFLRISLFSEKHLLKNLKNLSLDVALAPCRLAQNFSAHQTFDFNRALAERDLLVLAFRASDLDEFAR